MDPSWPNMLSKFEGMIVAYIGGVSPIIFILLPKLELEDLGSQIVLGGDIMISKLGFIRKLLLILRKLILDFDI